MPASLAVWRRLRLVGRRLTTWTPTWSWFRAVARSFVTSFLAVAVSLWLLPGEQVGKGAESIAAIVVGVLLVGALTRPLILRLTVVTGAFGLLLAGALAQVLILWLALSLVPSVERFSFGEVVLASWAAAVVATAVNWLFDASSDEAFLGQVLGRSVRETLRHPSSGPGLLVVQLDGVSEPLLRQAITGGAMPTVSRWLRSGTHELRGWHTGLPATTPAGQAVLLHGDVTAVPAFRWYDKSRGRMVVTSRPADLADVEKQLSDGRGLLADGGASVSNMFSGDAPSRVLTMSDARLPTSERGAASFATGRWGFVRSVVLFVGQMLTEWHQGRRQRRRDVRPRVHRGGAFVVLRGLTTVVLRDLNVSIVADHMARGTPVVFVDFVDYDEVAHHAGPSRPESMRTLEGLDRVLQFFEELADEVGRTYEIAVVSDHGQGQGTTFRQLDGRTLAEVVHALASQPVRSDRRDDRPVEPWGPANVLLTGASRHGSAVGTAARSAAQRRRDDDHTDPSDRLVVASSGSLAHVYLTDEPGRAGLETIDARYPHLLEGLATHPHIGAVAVRRDDGTLLAFGADGWRAPATGEGEGRDPLLAYGPDAAADLVALDLRNHVGDLIVMGRYDRSLGEVAAFEELVGSHGGLGGEQTEALLVHPTSWTVPAHRLGGLDVHAAMLARLDELGLRR